MFACVLLIAFCLLADVDASDSELLKKLQRIRRQMLETAMVIDREEGEPCPKVIAPFHIGGDASWGRRYIGGAFLNGFTPKRGPFAIGVKRRVTVIQRGPNEPCPVIVEDDRQFNIDAGLGPTGFAHFRGHGESERLGRGYKKWNLGLGVNRATVKSKGINIGIPLQARIVDLRSANCSRSTVTIIRQKVGHPEPIVVEDDRWASFDFNIGPRLDMDFYGGGNALMGSSPLTIHKPYFWGGAIDGRIGWAKRSSLTVIKLTDKESLPDIVVENRRAALEFNYGHKMGAESFGYGSVVKIHENQFSPHVLNQWSGSLEGSVGWGHGINFGAYLKPTIIRLGYDESEPDLDDCCVQDESFPIGISS
ncbi:Tyrosine recombinase XerC [Trichinella spiralis]|uniref:Tyrosine recombinase XerC n=2 Tax=Trichinella spiralis TaxID=6334 RepID=A0ABR3KAI4_TRISP